MVVSDIRVFCSLPLHAMGPIPPDTGSLRYFLDLYIPSYTPSLSALIESRKPSPHAISKPSILLVAQPDERKNVDGIERDESCPSRRYAGHDTLLDKG